MLTKNCIHCETPFDASSRRKRTVGGKITECPDCVEEFSLETAVLLKRYLV